MLSTVTSSARWLTREPSQDSGANYRDMRFGSSSFSPKTEEASVLSSGGRGFSVAASLRGGSDSRHYTGSAMQQQPPAGVGRLRRNGSGDMEITGRRLDASMLEQDTYRMGSGSPATTEPAPEIHPTGRRIGFNRESGLLAYERFKPLAGSPVNNTQFSPESTGSKIALFNASVVPRMAYESPLTFAGPPMDHNAKMTGSPAVHSPGQMQNSAIRQTSECKRDITFDAGSPGHFLEASTRLPSSVPPKQIQGPASSHDGASMVSGSMTRNPSRSLADGVRRDPVLLQFGTFGAHVSDVAVNSLSARSGSKTGARGMAPTSLGYPPENLHPSGSRGRGSDVVARRGSAGDISNNFTFYDSQKEPSAIGARTPALSGLISRASISPDPSANRRLHQEQQQRLRGHVRLTTTEECLPSPPKTERIRYKHVPMTSEFPARRQKGQEPAYLAYQRRLPYSRVGASRAPMRLLPPICEDRPQHPSPIQVSGSMALGNPGSSNPWPAGSLVNVHTEFETPYMSSRSCKCCVAVNTEVKASRTASL
eukprot:GHVU01227185.1.p1 GENE.GHVU01227185.1~~GHVU01227185.1.p1  ORF type:complete len:582 (+),score=34.33 GHVU01227185.1:135-1748(+)